jgi:Na+-transporting NADH:ubiquinone oxidoreductase subunit C
MPSETTASRGWFARTPNDAPVKILAVAILLCLVCATLVAAAAVLLQPIQQRNARLRQQQEILAVAGLYQEDRPVAEQFARIDARMVDLATGRYRDDIDPASFDIRRAARDPATSRPVPPSGDIAKIHRRPDAMPVYLVREGSRIDTIVLPVHGYGLWSTMYAYVALDGDARTIRGLTFHEHEETPGLGAEIENPRWLAQWPGKTALDSRGRVVLRITKGHAPTGSSSQIDAIAGATLTSRGVEQMIRYWLGQEGYGPYLERVRAGAST